MDDQADAAPAPWWSRLVVAITLGLMLTAFVVPVPFRLWPFTSWELFSRVRSSDQVSWQVRVVDTEGVETAMPFSRLGPGHSRWGQAARSLPAREVEERKEICRGWAEDSREVLGADAVVEVRIYRVVNRAAERIDLPPRPVEERLYLWCGAGS